VRNVVLPAIGVVLTVVLWLNVSAEAMTYGLIWLAVGFIALLVMTRLFRRRLHLSLQEDEVIAEGDEGAEALLDDDRKRLNAAE
jgi:putrescine importer